MPTGKFGFIVSSLVLVTWLDHIMKTLWYVLFTNLYSSRMHAY
jgi:hypothetical protein